MWFRWHCDRPPVPVPMFTPLRYIQSPWGEHRIASANSVPRMAVGTSGKATLAWQQGGGPYGDPCPPRGGGRSSLGLTGLGPRRGRGNEAFPGGRRACLCAELTDRMPSPRPLCSISAVSWSDFFI